jgi:transcriptional regulator with XRE-family HTH domain
MVASMRRRYTSSRAVPKLRVMLGQRVRALRQERNLSQLELGRKAGLSGKFIGEVERGDKSVSVDSLYRVATVLRVSLPSLLEEEGARTRRAGTAIRAAS